MLARRSTVRLTVVFNVAVWEPPPKADRDGLSRTGKSVPTTVPEALLVRTVIWERRCQLALAGLWVWVAMTVEPSFSLKVVSGRLALGSEMEPNASMVMTLPAWSRPEPIVVVLETREDSPLVDQAVTRQLLTCSGDTR